MKTTLPRKTGIREIGAGVWNLGPGRDPFGGPTRPDLPILQRLPLLAKAGITYVEFHDVELPFDQIPRAQQIMRQYGLKCGNVYSLLLRRSHL